MPHPTTPTTQVSRSLTAELNRECFCVTLDTGALSAALEREIGDGELFANLAKTHPHLFSAAPLFLPRDDLDAMLRVVHAVEATARLPDYRELVLSRAPAIAGRDHGPRGAFMGYDFHLAADGPRLIEVNTNAGGAYLNALLTKAQRACCAEVETALSRSGAEEFEQAVARMFADEWTLQRGAGVPARVAIVDDAPREQYLYPEFLLSRRLFIAQGLDAVIADPRELVYQNGRLATGGRPIDLVYNRLVDFALDRSDHAALRAAYEAGAVVVTPNPHVHALYADKRNLILLSDPVTLRAWGLPEGMIADLARVPRTLPVTADNKDALWAARKKLFFKPEAGHGSKGAYRGDKITKSVWEDVVGGGYVAQEFAPPGERMVRLDGKIEPRKADVRIYVYDGRLLLTAARLYQGQTTNFRTPGGGFAPVFAL